MVEPIKPYDVRPRTIPDEVITVFNEEIVRRMRGNEARVDQNVVLCEIQRVLQCSADTIFSNQWLDVEETFRAAGWIVEYHSPDWGERGGAYFVFRKPGR